MKHMTQGPANRLIASLDLSPSEFDEVVEAAGVDIAQDTLSDLNTLIMTHLAPKVELAKRQIDEAVNTTATKLKAWAFLHLQQAAKLKRPTALFEKILRDPKAAASQLAREILGEDKAPKVKDAEELQTLDDVLENIKM